MYFVNHISSLNSKHTSIKVIRKSVTPNRFTNVVCYSCVRCVICGLSTIMKDYIWEGRHVLLFGSRPTLQFLFHDIAKKKIFKEVQTANAYYKITCHRIELGIWFSISMHFEIDVQHRLCTLFCTNLDAFSSKTFLIRRNDLYFLIYANSHLSHLSLMQVVCQ